MNLYFFFYTILKNECLLIVISVDANECFICVLDVPFLMLIAHLFCVL